jgi:hypothetical protein
MNNVFLALQTPRPPISAFPHHLSSNALDPHGDHLFRCTFTKRNKTSFHNHVRDTLFVILSTPLSHLSGLTCSKHDVQLEAKHRLPDGCPHQTL